MGTTAELSRQRKWQIRKKALGLCTTCGKEKIFKGERCIKHYFRQKRYTKNYIDKDPEFYAKFYERYFKKWRKNHPDYAKRYRAKKLIEKNKKLEEKNNE